MGLDSGSRLEFFVPNLLQLYPMHHLEFVKTMPVRIPVERLVWASAIQLVMEKAMVTVTAPGLEWALEWVSG